MKQVHNPGKGRRPELCWKIYFKHAGASMLLFDGLTFAGASTRVSMLKKFYSGWKGSFIVTK